MRVADCRMSTTRVQRRRPSIVTPWRTRLLAFGPAALATIAIAVLAPAWLHGILRGVAAYDAGTLVLLAVCWTLGMQQDPRRTSARASMEDPGRNAVLGVVLLTVAVALISAISILGRGPHVPTATEKAFVYGLGIAAVVLGWGLIHTMFTFRYAHMYYFDDDDDNEADRGLKFPGTDDPNDYDFAYFAFVIGMTFQVSDVQITDRGVRRVALGHGLISFAYNTAILALGINIISGLLH